MEPGLVEDWKRGSKREWHELTQRDGKRGAVRKDRDVNVVITNHCMHNDEAVGTRIGGLGKNGFLERRGACRSRLGDWTKCDKKSGMDGPV
jgi:hypothetical protein